MKKQTLLLAGAVIFLFISLFGALFVYVAIPFFYSLYFPPMPSNLDDPCGTSWVSDPSGMTAKLSMLCMISRTVVPTALLLFFILGIICLILYYKEKKKKIRQA